MLLGAVSGTKISRYENFGRMPKAFTVFAFEIVFNQPAHELFAGDYEEIRDAVQKRAKAMLNKLLGAQNAVDPATIRKIGVLRAIVEAPKTSKRAHA